MGLCGETYSVNPGDGGNRNWKLVLGKGIFILGSEGCGCWGTMA